MNFRANGVSLVEISSRLSSVRLVWCMFGRENQNKLAQSGPRSSGRGAPRCVVLSFISEMYWSAFRSCTPNDLKLAEGKQRKGTCCRDAVQIASLQSERLAQKPRYSSTPRPFHMAEKVGPGSAGLNQDPPIVELFLYGEISQT